MRNMTATANYRVAISGIKKFLDADDSPPGTLMNYSAYSIGTS